MNTRKQIIFDFPRYAELRGKETVEVLQLVDRNNAEVKILAERYEAEDDYKEIMEAKLSQITTDVIQLAETITLELATIRNLIYRDDKPRVNNHEVFEKLLRQREQSIAKTLCDILDELEDY